MALLAAVVAGAVGAVLGYTVEVTGVVDHSVLVTVEGCMGVVCSEPSLVASVVVLLLLLGEGSVDRNQVTVTSR